LLWAIWKWRGVRAVKLAAVCLLQVLCAGAILAILWQSRQPLAGGIMTLEHPSWMKAAGFPLQLTLTLAFLILPAAVRPGKRLSGTSGRLYAISSLVVLGGLIACWRISHHLLFPWMDNMMTPVGILLSGQEMRGVRPVVLNRGVRIAITLAVLIVLVRIVAVLLSSGGFTGWRSRVRSLRELPASLQILSIFGAVYGGFLLLQSRLVIYDRYLLPLIPLVLIAVLLLNQRLSGTSPTAVNWALLALFAFYGIASSHDYFAGLQARVSAFQRVEAAGIAARNISGGLELDGWTQAQIAKRIYVPNPAATPTGQNSAGSGFWFLTFTPDIHPKYFLSWSEEPGLRNASIAGVSFGAWLPPFGRQVKILVPETTP